MKIVRHHYATPPGLQGAVVAIGNFDGIHRGHRQVIAKTGRIARELGAPFGVMTFEPHPSLFFNPDVPPFRLTPFRVKARLIASLGTDVLFAQHFNQQFSQITADAFIDEVLVGGMQIRHVVVGHDFQFGKGRQGTPDLLRAGGQRHGFGVTILDAVKGDAEEAFSSTLVRQYLRDGKVTRAALFLGRYWEIEGRVKEGSKLGRTIGYPTANISLGEIIRPAFGVYAVRLAVEGTDEGWLPGVASIGVRPTVEVDGAEPLLEVYLFDYDGDLYGRHVRVALVDFLRPEEKFASIEAMTAQIARDCAEARATLSWEGIDVDWPSSPFLRVRTDDPTG